MNGLVLSGGGARAAYQVGVLSYIAERAREVSFPIITGVSAGAINAAFIAGARGDPRSKLQNLSAAWNGLSIDRVFRTAIGTLGVSGVRWAWTVGGGGTSLGPQVKGFVDTSPLRSFLEEHIDTDGIVHNIESGELRALGLTASSYSTGQLITFVHGRPGTPTWERVRRCGRKAEIGVAHVMASSAIPLIFPAIEIDGDYYGDGSMRQLAPLAPAIHLGADRLLAIATRYRPTLEESRRRAVSGYPPPAQIIGLLFNTIFMEALDADAERLERLNRVIDALPPGASTPAELRPIELLVVRPSRDLGMMAGKFSKLLPRSLRFLLRGLGIHRVRQADLVSYLGFEAPYLSLVMELGYEDALSQWPEIETFLSKS